MDVEIVEVKFNLKQFFANLLKLDYVVEMGNINGWEYRKWSSGRLECWCNYSSVSVKLSGKQSFATFSTPVLPFTPINPDTEGWCRVTVKTDAGTDGIYTINNAWFQYNKVCSQIRTVKTGFDGVTIKLDYTAYFVGKWKNSRWK